MQPIAITQCCLYVHVFRDGNLGLDKIARGLSLEKTEPPSLNSYELPVALDLG